MRVQGSITVRRRPLNGDNGSDAVIYWLVPSVSTVRKSADGVLIPTSVSCMKMKQVGNNATAVTTEMQLRYQLSNGNQTNYTGAVNIGTATYVIFTLHDGINILDSVTVPVVVDGSDGQDAYSISLTNENVSVPYNSTGTTPSVTLNTIFTEVVAYKGITRIPARIGNVTGLTISNNDTISPRATVSALTSDLNRFDLIITADGKQFYKTFTVSKVKDGGTGSPGAPGQQGLQGCIIRRTDWATGFEYRNDSALTSAGFRYIDLVHLVGDDDKTWYEAKAAHNGVISTEANKPGTTSGGAYWTKANILNPIYTPMVIADNAFIKFGQGNEFVIQKPDGEITAGMSGSVNGDKIRFWAGSDTPDNAPYRVDEAGKLISDKAEIRNGSKLGNLTVYNNFLRYTDNYYYIGIGLGVMPSTSGIRNTMYLEDKSTSTESKSLIILNATPTPGLGFEDARVDYKAINVISGTVRVAPGNLLDAPGVILAGRIGFNGDMQYQWGRKGRGQLNASYAFASSRSGTYYTIEHFLGHTNYTVQVTTIQNVGEWNGKLPMITNIESNRFILTFSDTGTANRYFQSAFSFTVIGENS